MKETLKNRIEKIQNEVRELGAERLRLEKLQENIAAGLAQIDKAVAQKAGALKELGGLMELLDAKEEEKPSKKPALVVEEKSLGDGEKKKV